MENNMENKSSKAWVWIIVVIVIVVGAILLFKNKGTTTTDTTPPVVTEEPASTEDTSGGSPNIVSGSNMAYGDAVKAYGDNRIQLDKTCQAHPNNVTFKTGTSIMIDNRSPQTTKVRLGDTFTIKPYGFKIVKLAGTTLPVTYYIDCGTSQNVATVLVQK